eukprot:GILK01002225.1.p1 GENE.GILK01002225.1~~GILK01002225.1.p1  ORF type:complete len:448 (+),score=74.52 GILK01002225.1:72-1346(+)
MTTFLSRFRNAAQVVCISNSRQSVKKGADMQNLCIIENGTVIVGHDGCIVDVGPAQLMESKYPDVTYEKDFDCSGMVIVPGLVDAHTHPVWSGDRVHEFAMKLAGATYMDIHNAGGGIGFTVKHTRQSSEAELYALLIGRLDRMLTLGTTLVEAKSGYGLNTPDEMKMLKVIEWANQTHMVDIVSTYCGGHAIPPGMTAAQAADDIINNQIPALHALQTSNQINVEMIDVFCEKGVFELEDSRRILEAGKAAGLAVNFHGEELHPLNSAVMGAQLQARAISHLEHLSEEGIAAMAQADVIGVLLPTTHYILHLRDPPTRKMIQSNVAVALGSDFNPNAHCLSMPLTMNLACVNYKMTMPEALVAATLNAAASMNRSDSHGSLEPGKVGDMLILGAPAWEHLIYQMVDPPIAAVIKHGQVVRGSL